MKFKARKRLRLGPVILYFGFPPLRMTSWGLKVGSWTWNARTRRHTYDTPGPGSVTWGGNQKSEIRR
jgi:hypothetical protein